MITEWLLKTPIAHRGLHNGIDIIENTATAFRLAVDGGFAIEIDLRLTADKQVIVVHDARLSRVCGVDLEVFKTSYEEISKHCIKGSNEYIMLFSDFLRLINGKTPVLIELKPVKKYKELCVAVTECLKGYAGEYALQSFNPLIMNYLHRSFAGKVPLGILSPSYPKMPPFIRGNLKYFTVLRFKPDFLSQNWQLLDAVPTRIMRKRGVPVITWTVTTKEILEKIKGKAENIIFESIYTKLPPSSAT